MSATTRRQPTPPSLYAEAKEHRASTLFNRLYNLAAEEPPASPRRTLLDDAAGRAVRLLERVRRETRRTRYRITPDGLFAVVEWIPAYDGRDAITGHIKFTLARFESFEDAERFIECEYGERCESRMEIEGPFCHVRQPQIDLAVGGDDLPF